MGTQPYKSPDLESTTTKHGSGIQRVTPRAAEELREHPAADGGGSNIPPPAATPPQDADGGKGEGAESEADVDEALDDSFPASDPPSSSSTPKKV